MTNEERDKSGQVGDVESTGEGPYGPTETKRVISDDFYWHRFAASYINGINKDEITVAPGRTDGEFVFTYPIDSLFPGLTKMAIATERAVASVYVQSHDDIYPDHPVLHTPDYIAEMVRAKTKRMITDFFTDAVDGQRISSPKRIAGRQGITVEELTQIRQNRPVKMER